MVTKKNETEYKKTPLNIIWRILIYGSFTAIGVLLIFIYGGYVFINK